MKPTLSLKKIISSIIFATSCSTISLAADAVIAKVDSIEIRQSELEDFKKIFPPQLIEAATKKDPQKFYVTLVRQLVDLKLAIQDARKSGIENNPDVKKALEAMKDQLLFKAYISEKLKNVVTEEAVRKIYDEERKNMPKDAMETRARHILVKDEETAKKLIKELEGGADFMKLARQHSIDKATAQEGGDLGFFMKEDFVPEFTQVAFKLEPGKFAKEPVKSQFGYHVIKVDERRRAKVKPLEQEKERIQSILVEKATTDLMKGLRSKATITIFDEKGLPMKDAMKDEEAPKEASESK
jgi:peptidyl-prolyl cis-trans isomerase C